MTVNAIPTPLPVQPRFFYGYVVVAAAFGIQVVGWGTHNSFGVFFSPLQAAFDCTRATISAAASLSMLTAGLTGVALGRLNDRYGPRPVMSASGLLLGVGFILLARATTVFHVFLGYSLLIGMGISGTDVVPLSTVARWFIKRRSTMSGVIKVGTGVGMLIMPMVITRLMAAYGWRGSTTILALVIAGVYLVGAQFLERDPSRRGLQPDNASPADATGPAAGALGLSLRQALATGVFWRCCLLHFVLIFCAYTVLMHLVSYAGDLGFSAAAAADVLALVGGVSIAGRILLGAAGDRRTNRAAVTAAFGLLVVSFLWLLAGRQAWALHLFAVLYGFAHGGLFALESPLTAELFGLRAHGVILGLMILGGTLGGALGPVIAGYLFDLTGSYTAGFTLLAVMAAVGLGLSASLEPAPLPGP